MLDRAYHRRITFDDLKKLYLNRQTQIGKKANGEPLVVNVADYWLRHPDRHQYIGGVIFDPSEKNTRDDMLNLWTGFNYTPQPGSWKKLRIHVRKVICDGNRDHFNYLMGWMARMVQFPAKQGEVAVVMRGGEGTGKGTLANSLKKIMGQHGLTISSSKHLTGNFNGHLRDCVFLFADEAFFAGDKANVGALKALITEPYVTIEAKYANATQTPNLIHLMMASNEEWVVPASRDSRRFFVLDVPDTKKGDHGYFKAIHDEMENGGYQAFLYDLLNYDLSDYNVRDFPVTSALQDQRKLTLGTPEGWWMDVLQRGYVFKSRIGLDSYFNEWHDTVSTELLYRSYEDYAKEHRERHPMSREYLGRFMKTFTGATSLRPRNVIIGEHIVDEETSDGRIVRKTAPIIKDRAPGYQVGSLAVAREAFTRATALEVEWDQHDDEEEAEDDKPKLRKGTRERIDRAWAAQMRQTKKSG